MEETQSKKVIILYILKILKEFSDEEHPITQCFKYFFSNFNIAFISIIWLYHIIF